MRSHTAHRALALAVAVTLLGAAIRPVAATAAMGEKAELESQNDKKAASASRFRCTLERSAGVGMTALGSVLIFLGAANGDFSLVKKGISMVLKGAQVTAGCQEKIDGKPKVTPGKSGPKWKPRPKWPKPRGPGPTNPTRTDPRSNPATWPGRFPRR